MSHFHLDSDSDHSIIHQDSDDDNVEHDDDIDIGFRRHHYETPADITLEIGPTLSSTSSGSGGILAAAAAGKGSGGGGDQGLQLPAVT